MTGAIHPENVLADDESHADIGGVTLRKGTVAAFVQNAKRLEVVPEDSAEAVELRTALAHAVPALRAIGLLDVFAPVSTQLQAIIESGEASED